MQSDRKKRMKSSHSSIIEKTVEPQGVVGHFVFFKVIICVALRSRWVNKVSKEDGRIYSHTNHRIRQKTECIEATSRYYSVCQHDDEYDLALHDRLMFVQTESKN